jgi:hypothetical protein
MKFAPIPAFLYNRLQRSSRLVTSLLPNRKVQSSHIHVLPDAAKTSAAQTLGQAADAAVRSAGVPRLEILERAQITCFQR